MQKTFEFENSPIIVDFNDKFLFIDECFYVKHIIAKTELKSRTNLGRLKRVYYLEFSTIYGKKIIHEFDPFLHINTKEIETLLEDSCDWDLFYDEIQIHIDNQILNIYQKVISSLMIK